VATDSGAGYTWSANSHDNRLTPWANDPSAIHRRGDLHSRRGTGQFWSATPLPAGGGERYVVRHGQGYTTFDHDRNGLRSTLVLFVPPMDEAKLFHLIAPNSRPPKPAFRGDVLCRLGLGESRAQSHLHVVTSQTQTLSGVCAQCRSARVRASRCLSGSAPGATRRSRAIALEFLGAMAA